MHLNDIPQCFSNPVTLVGWNFNSAFLDLKINMKENRGFPSNIWKVLWFNYFNDSWWEWCTQRVYMMKAYSYK